MPDGISDCARTLQSFMRNVVFVARLRIGITFSVKALALSLDAGVMLVESSSALQCSTMISVFDLPESRLERRRP